MATFVQGFSRTIRLPGGGFTVGPAWNRPASGAGPLAEPGSNVSSYQRAFSSGQLQEPAQWRNPWGTQNDPLLDPLRLSGSDDAHGPTNSPRLSLVHDATRGRGIDAETQAYIEWMRVFQEAPIDHRFDVQVYSEDNALLEIYSPWGKDGLQISGPVPQRIRMRSLSSILWNLMQSVAIFSHPYPERYWAKRELQLQGDFLRRFINRRVDPSLERFTREWIKINRAQSQRVGPQGGTITPFEDERKFRFMGIHYFLRSDEQRYIGRLPDAERTQAAYELLHAKYAGWVLLLHNQLPFHEMDRLLCAPIAIRREIGRFHDHDLTPENFLSLLQPARAPRPTWFVGADDRQMLEAIAAEVRAEFRQILGTQFEALLSDQDGPREEVLDRYLTEFAARMNEGMRGSVPQDGEDRRAFLRQELFRFEAAHVIPEFIHYLTYVKKALSFQTLRNIPSVLALFDSKTDADTLRNIVKLFVADAALAREAVQTLYGDPYFEALKGPFFDRGDDPEE